MYFQFSLKICFSGVQTSENGPIQWNRELPTTCLLSTGIKKHVTPLLAGLLEVNPQRMWTFEKFFSEVTRILNKKKIHIYYMTKLTEHRVYLDKEENLEQFQVLLAQQAGLTFNIHKLLHS
jgi:TANK-binding kinase 1